MNIRTAPYRLALALLGATLVLWGAKAAVLFMPMTGNLNLFVMNKAAAWTLCCATSIAVVFSVLPPRWLAWAALGTAVGAICSLCYMLIARVQHLKELGAPEDVINQALRDITIKPGAVAVLCGITILAVALGMKRR